MVPAMCCPARLNLEYDTRGMCVTRGMYVLKPQGSRTPSTYDTPPCSEAGVEGSTESEGVDACVDSGQQLLPRSLAAASSRVSPRGT